MKTRYINILSLMLGVLTLISCEIDNMEGPTGGLKGSIIDEQTGELIQQDIINGCKIELREHGYENVQAQTIVIKNDGNYENSRLFNATYDIVPLRPNFIQVESQPVTISGSTELDFVVTPYIRINDVSVTMVGSKVQATFTLEQTIDTVNVKAIGFYAHPDPNVAQSMQVAKAETFINAIVDPAFQYLLEIDTRRDADFRNGGKFFFRIGALLDYPEASYNYVQAVEIDL